MSDDDFVLPVLPEYQPCWISYLGAASGILRSLGKMVGIDQVGGYSGWSFLVNIHTKDLCPSGPTAHKAYGEIIKGTESLGFNVSGINQPDLITEDEGEVKQDVLFERFFTKLKQDLNKLNKPAIIWGIPVPEYGIVYGFSGDSYIVSTLRHLHNQPEDPIKFNELQAPGGLHAFYFTDENEGITEEKNKEAIERAIRMAKGDGFTVPNYVAGPMAFDVWASILEKGEFDKNSYHGNSYNAACTHEGLHVSAEFLYSLAIEFSGTQMEDFLKKASTEYEEAADLMKEFVEIFPFGFEGKLSKDNCLKGVELLRTIKPKIEKAIHFMKDAISN